MFYFILKYKMTFILQNEDKTFLHLKQKHCQCPSDSTVGNTFAFYVSNPDSIPSNLYGLEPARRNTF